MQIYGNINNQALKPTRNMVSKGKRNNKYDLSSSEDESIEDHCDDPGYVPNMDIKNTTKTSTRGRKPKCFTKNAMMARENRLKKMYISKLEQNVDLLRKENKNLTAVVDNQSMLIANLRKEVKYLKSVITNSSDIGCLIRAINQNTSLPLRTSLDENYVKPLNILLLQSRLQ
nr:unnamed protein product [Callosobruchus chinensis]